MRYERMIMEVESPEQVGYDRVRVNLAESSMRDRTLADLGFDPASLSEVPLQYMDHRGTEALRAAIAADAGGALAPDDVLVTVGAAGALFLVATALLESGDRIVVARPNYASNLETPRAIGAEIVPLDLSPDDGFRVDPEGLASLLAPGAKLVSLTSPHNPTGAVISPDDLRTIIRIVELSGTWLLLDETYRELAEGLAPASTLGERVIAVSSLSKTYGVPGIRVGWLTCRDRGLMTTLLAGQEQATLSHSTLDMAVAEWVLGRRAELLPDIRRQVAGQHRIVRDWIAGERRMRWVEPAGGVVCLPWIADAGIDARAFHARLQDRGVFVGPGWWFEQPANFMRIGFGYPTAAELHEGLATISDVLDEVGG